MKENSPRRARRDHGRYLGAWNAYPGAGYEEGAAVIGLAWATICCTGSSPTRSCSSGWRALGARRSLPSEPDRRRRHLLSLLQRQDRHAARIPRRWMARADRRCNLPRSQTLDALRRQSRPAQRRLTTRGTPASHPIRMWCATAASGPCSISVSTATSGPRCECSPSAPTPITSPKSNEILIDVGAPGTIDETFAHKPSVIYHDGALYHFYCAVSGK